MPQELVARERTAGAGEAEGEAEPDDTRAMTISTMG